MRFSARIPNATLNAPARTAREATASGHPPFNLADSNPTRHGLGTPILNNPWASDPRGPLASRRLLANFLAASGHRAVDPDNLYLLSSTSQGYAWLFKLLCDPGSAVLSPTPGYPLVSTLADLENVEEIPYPLHFDGTWYVDVAEVERILRATNRVRALVLISPNNPTGSYLHAEDIAALTRLCTRFNIPIIADEVFFDFRFASGNGYTHASGPVGQRLAGRPEVLTFALDGLSKKLAAPQAKVGWIEVSGPDADVREAKARLDVVADAYLPVSSLTVERLPELLAGVPERLEAVGARTARNLTALERAVSADASGLTTVLIPEAGWNALIRFPATVDEDALVTTLIRERGYTAQPGYFFDMASPGYVSVSLLLEPTVFDAGVAAILETVARLAG